jgi:hypothetical protein
MQASVTVSLYCVSDSADECYPVTLVESGVYSDETSTDSGVRSQLSTVLRAQTFGDERSHHRDGERAILETPGVRLVLSSSGGSFLGGANQGSAYVRIAPHEERTLSFGKFWTS